MPEENVELIRRAVKAFNDRDLAALDDLVTEDFEFVPYMATLIETTTYRGERDSASTRRTLTRRGRASRRTWTRFATLGIAWSFSVRSARTAGAAAWMSRFRLRGWWIFTTGS